MNSGLYTIQISCPICEKSFPAIKAKNTAYKLERVDEDFCMHYSDLNPLLYEPWVCEHCGYTEFGVYFDRLSVIDKDKLRKLCLMKFTEDPTKNPFELTDFHKQVYGFFDTLSSEGERDNLSAIEAFKLLMLNLEARNAPHSVKAKAVLRIGWIYRIMNDSREMEYLEEASSHFAKAYESESFEVGKFDSATCAYVIGELNRRIGKVKEAMEWFSRALSSAPNSENPKITEKIRDQMLIIKSSSEYTSSKS